MMWMLFGLLIIGGIYVACFSDTKLGSRLAWKAKNVEKTLADVAGDAKDDRAAKIHSGRKSINELKVEVVNVRAENIRLAEQAEEYVVEAEKYARLAEKAMTNGDTEAAQKAVKFQMMAEKRVEGLRSSLKISESLEENILGQLKDMESNLQEAELTQSAFTAELKSLELQERMQKSSAFTNAAALDFSEEDSILEDMRARVQAGNEIAGLLGDGDLDKYEADDEIAQRMLLLENKVKENANV